MSTLDLTRSHVFRDGRLVSDKIAKIVDAIRDYEPELDVQWVPPEARNEGQAAFAIIHRPVGGKDYVLFYVMDESEFDERVLARIIYNDQRNVSKTYSELEAAEQTKKLLERQEWLDKMEEANDIAFHVFRSHKNKYVVDKNTVIHDHGDRVRW